MNWVSSRWRLKSKGVKPVLDPLLTVRRFRHDYHVESESRYFPSELLNKALRRGDEGLLFALIDFVDRVAKLLRARAFDFDEDYDFIFETDQVNLIVSTTIVSCDNLAALRFEEFRCARLEA